MNPLLAALQPYPFERLAALKADLTPPSDKTPIVLSIGEPQHAVPDFVAPLLTTTGLSTYPPTKGSLALRETIAQWLIRRFALPPDSLDPQRHILPVNGTREALFAFAQAVIDPQSTNPLVVMPNPFYQIYEGAALLAGAQPYFLNTTAATGFLPDYDAVPEVIWQRCQLVYLCSPANPTGTVTPLSMLHDLMAKADRYDFVIAADECYCELYMDETQPPVGLLQACAQFGRTDYRRCVVFHSLSKRSNLPGLRSGFVAGDADILRQFLHYRTYHGCAMSPLVQAISQAAWSDETHVVENRALYRQKFAAVLDILSPVLDLTLPDGGFYLWPQCPISDVAFARQLFTQQHVTVLPGTYLARQAHGHNPGQQRVRIALVAPLATCVDAARRIRDLLTRLT